MGWTDPGGDLGQAEFEIGIAEQEREDLALLLGAQDGQERGGRLSIHYLKNTLQFADSRRELYLAAADDGCGRGASRPL